MSEDAAHTKSIRGMGKVFTSDEVFSDFDNVGAGRLSRRSDKYDVEEDVNSEEMSAPQTRDVWIDIPSIADQEKKHPSTVRFGPSTTVTLNLSVSEDLDRLNQLHVAKMAKPGLAIVIQEMDRQFFEGTWYAYVTYAKLQYQKL